MASIPKIVSTPVKWASKQAIHRTLLRFPGGDSQSPLACVYCPEMCRFACPSAVASGNDAVTPSNKMSLLQQEVLWPGRASQGEELWPIYDCTGCGRCTEYCVYEIPVAERLFQSRAENSWERAAEVRDTLTDQTDRWGDLAAELGDETLGKARAQNWVRSRFGAKKAALEVNEPKGLFYLQSLGISATLSWERVFQESYLTSAEGKRFVHLLSSLQAELKAPLLLSESVWLSRRMKRSSEVLALVERLREQGVSLVLPFEHGKDCIDSGGEGAYALLFESAAKQMALDFWERDRVRCGAVLALSPRAAEHFRRCGIRAFSWVELLEQAQKQASE